MKPTMMFRKIANPRRTTLAHLTETDGVTLQQQPAQPPEDIADLPAQTANPRRTVLMVLPGQETQVAQPQPSGAA